MSWVTGLVGKAEDLLNKMDQTAAEALHQDSNRKGTTPAISVNNKSKLHNSQTYSEKLSSSSEKKTEKTDKATIKSSSSGGSLSSSASVPSNLNKLNQDSYLSQLNRTSFSGSKSANPSRQNSRKDKDDELFEFLNSSKNPSPGSTSAKTTPETKRKQEKVPKTVTNGRHSRNSSGSSTVSNKSNNKPQETTASTEKPVLAATDDTDTSSLDQSSNENNHEEVLGNNDSSGYHSNQEESTSQQQLSSLELENKLLKSEVSALNQEMASVLKRSQEAQHDLERSRRKMDTHNHQVAQMEQIMRELQSRETDLNEALSAKDSQLAVLRVRYEEATKEVDGKNKTIEKLISEKDRILKDHSQSSGVHGQALESLKDKLTETETMLRRDQEAHRLSQEESFERQSRMDSEMKSLAESLTIAERKLSEEKGRHSDLHMQLKSAKSSADMARQELSEYKNKAARILQSKDKLISSLKEGSAVLHGDMGVSTVEFDSLKQERDMLKEELQQARMTMDAMRTELQELETQMQADGDAAQEQISSLEEQLLNQRRRLEDVEQENSRQKMELRYTHDEMLKQKTTFLQQIQDRESDIEKLRHQLSSRNMNTNSQLELENRLHALTESLIQKQTMLEALSTEKNSLVLQLERLEQQYRDVQASVIKVNTSSISMHDDEDDVRHRLPMFMREMPHDGDVTRNVKRAVTSIDKFSVRLGVFLRRYPAARVFIIVYMFLLHLWVMVVLLTYQPEMHHGKDFLPHNPAP